MAPGVNVTVDVFLSYAREDRPCAERLAEAFSACGWRVWWDREIEVGDDFGAQIESNLLSARIVVVLWSEHSIHSGFVKDEAARARDASKLHPVRIGDVSIPIGFGQLQTFDLLECGTSDADVRPLIDQLGRAMSKAPVIAPARAGAGLIRVFRRPSTRLAAAGLLAAAVLGFAGRGWWRDRQCDQSIGRTDAGVDKLQDGNTEQAIDYLTEAIVMCGELPRPYRYRGEAYARLNDYPPAIADLNMALRLGLEDHSKKRVTDLLVTIQKAQDNGALAVSTQPTETAPPATSGGAPATAPGSATAVTPPPVLMKGPPPGGRPGVATTAARPVSADAPKADAETQQAVKNMFAGDKDTRIAATTALVLDPRRAAAAVPVALQIATDQIANASGVVNTLVLLQSAGPNVLRQHRDEIERLLTRAQDNGPETAGLVAKVRAGFTPLVYIQIASDAQQTVGQRLKRELQANGFEVPAVENISAKAAAPAAVPEVRVQGTGGRGVAQIIGGIVQRITSTAPRIVSISKATPQRDVYELWLDKRTCVETRPPACAP
jgi:tetratricopeptide (TPR) repeat protein